MTEPHVLMVTPFVVLLLAIALMPFIHKHHWENHYPKVAIGLGLIRREVGVGEELLAGGQPATVVALPFGPEDLDG